MEQLTAMLYAYSFHSGNNADSILMRQRFFCSREHWGLSHLHLYGPVYRIDGDKLWG